MTIADLIGPDRVLIGLRVADKGGLLAELARRAAPAATLEPAVILHALAARENLGSTGLGKGFALPHARLERLPQVFAMFARLHRPIDYAAIDDKPVDLVVLLLTPENGSGQHLATLAALSRQLRDEALLKRLRRAPDAVAVYRLLASV